MRGRPRELTEQGACNSLVCHMQGTEAEHQGDIEVQDQDFWDALDQLQPSISPAELKRYNALRDQYQSRGSQGFSKAAGPPSHSKRAVQAAEAGTPTQNVAVNAMGNGRPAQEPAGQQQQVPLKSQLDHSLADTSAEQPQQAPPAPAAPRGGLGPMLPPKPMKKSKYTAPAKDIAEQ